MTGKALQISGVVKSYGEVRALDGVSFNVEAGGFTALLGPNGAGKSTLFQLLSGLFTADDGQIVVAGYNMAINPVPALAALGIVFQQSTIDPELSVRANLRFHAGLHGLARAEADMRIDSLLAQFGLAGQAASKAGHLSGGNRRRVELARALLHHPKILLMDEATAGLDPASRSQLLHQVGQLRKTSNVAVLWATHLCAEVDAASQLVVLDHGRVLFDGTSANFLTTTQAPSIEQGFLRLTGAHVA